MDLYTPYEWDGNFSFFFKYSNELAPFWCQNTEWDPFLKSHLYDLSTCHISKRPRLFDIKKFECTWNQLTFHFKFSQSDRHAVSKLSHQRTSKTEVVRLWLMDRFYFDLDFVQIFSDNWWPHNNILLLSTQNGSVFFLPFYLLLTVATVK